MPNIVSLIFRILCDSQDNFLDNECDKVQGEDLLDQSADSKEEPMEQEVVMLIEVQPADPGHMLACSDKGIFTEAGLITSRHVVAVNSPTEEDSGVPAPSSAGHLSLSKTLPWIPTQRGRTWD